MNVLNDDLPEKLMIAEEFKAFIDNIFYDEENLLKLDELKFLLKRNQEYKIKRTEIGFNLFNIISDTYYKENFHSDIIKAILDPQEKHSEGNKYLFLFIKLLNDVIKKNQKLETISEEHFAISEVMREENKIDILIKSNESKKAIIIENKINNAIDRDRQLPRYLEETEMSGYNVVVIVYLILNTLKEPDKSNWSQIEINKINEKLIIIPAYNETPNDLLNGWIRACEQSSNNINSLFLLRQYGDLIRQLGGNNMNKPIMQKFFNLVIEDNNFETIQSLKSMFDELIPFRRDKIIDKYRDNLFPFKNIGPYEYYSQYAAVFGFKNVGRLGMDVWLEVDRYKLQIYDHDFNGNNEESINGAKMVLNDIGLLNEFTEAGTRMQKIFKFPSEENQLYDLINLFLKKTTESKQLNSYFSRIA